MHNDVVKDRIIFKIPKDLKKEFKEACDVVGIDMTSVLLTSIADFIDKSKQNPKK